MKNTLLACISCVLICHLAIAQPFERDARKQGIGIQFYKNIEFLGVTFFMGYLGPRYEHDTTPMPNGVKKQDWFAYDFALYHKYRSFAANPDLALIASFAEQNDGSNLARLLIHLDEFPRAAIRRNIEAQYLQPFLKGKKDTIAAKKEVEAFIEAANRFYKTINFDAYFRENSRYYEQALKEIRSVLPEEQLITTMEKFYRQQAHRYKLVPSLTIPAGMGFGVSYTTAGKTTIINLFGPFARQQLTGASLNMGFADENHIRELSTHEFGHSFSNPAVASIPKELIKATEQHFAPVKETMENQGYNTWQSCVYEYFVRAGEVVIAWKLGKHEAAERLQQQYMQQRKFIYLPLVIDELEKYDRDPGLTYQQAVVNTLERLKTQR